MNNTNTNFKLNQIRRKEKKESKNQSNLKRKEKDTIHQSQGAMSLALQSKRKLQFKISFFLSR